MLGGPFAVLVVCEALPLGVEALSRFKQELSMKPPHKQRSANDASRRQNAGSAKRCRTGIHTPVGNCISMTYIQSKGLSGHGGEYITIQYSASSQVTIVKL